MILFLKGRYDRGRDSLNVPVAKRAYVVNMFYSVRINKEAKKRMEDLMVL